MKKLVFNAAKWGPTGDVGDNSQFWEEAEILRQYDDDDYHELLADVQFPDGTISSGHFISAMRDIVTLEDRVAKLEEWSHKPQPVLDPQTFDKIMGTVYASLNDLRDRIQALEPE